MTPFAIPRVSRLLHPAAAVMIGWSICRINACLGKRVARAVFPTVAKSDPTKQLASIILRRFRRN